MAQWEMSTVCKPANMIFDHHEGRPKSDHIKFASTLHISAMVYKPLTINYINRNTDQHLMAVPLSIITA